jgi:hypothetical protein
MISALEIGFALSVLSLVIGYVALRPKPVPVPVRIRDARQRRRPNV